MRVGDIRNRQHYERAQKKYRNYIIRLGVLAGFIVALIIAGIIVYNSAAFTIENVDVKGADHLTSTDIDALVEEWLDFLKQSNATKKIVAPVMEAVARAKEQKEGS